jgi:hypothetical protein
MKKLYCLSVILFFFNTNINSQSLYYVDPDSTKEKPTQYRRGIELQDGYQSYEEKYAGKNLNELKRSLFPLESTGIWTELNPRIPRVLMSGFTLLTKIPAG